MLWPRVQLLTGGSAEPATFLLTSPMCRAQGSQVTPKAQHPRREHSKEVRSGSAGDVGSPARGFAGFRASGLRLRTRSVERGFGGRGNQEDLARGARGRATLACGGLAQSGE